MDDKGDILPGLKPVKDFRSVGLAVWNEFVRIYGGGPLIQSSTVSIGESNPDWSS